MKVKKRDGTLVPVRLDEITDRIAFLSKDLDEKIIDPVKITLEVVEKIYDGIPTSVIDSFTAEICHSRSIEHPHFNILASRLVIGDHQKTVQIMANLKFSQVCKLLYNTTDQLGESSPLISEELYGVSQEYKDIIDNMIVNDRDFLLDYFGFKTLYKSYLFKIAGNYEIDRDDKNKDKDDKNRETKTEVIETPQHMFMRVALGIHGRFKSNDTVNENGETVEGKIIEPDFELVKETYDLLSTKYFTHATPTLYNSGTNKPQLFSCFLLGMDDSLKSIYQTLANTAQISKWSGGIGIHIHEIRANGSYIRGTAGKGDGIVPMLKVYNDTARYVNQGGKRSGSFAIYLEPWHADIQDFLKCKLPHGDESRRSRDLFYALWIPDLFMERVKNKEKWSLMCPSESPGLANVYGNDFKELYERYEKEGRIIKTVDAQSLWHEIIKSQIETGTPYMTYKDAANYKSNQKNVGVIKSSNLCVAPETRILTKEGYYEIKDLVNKQIEVWNGEEWSKTEVKQTGSDQKLIKVSLSNGTTIHCTEYHKFITEIGSRPSDKSVEQIVEAKDLKLDTKLIKYDLPIIRDGLKQFDVSKKFEVPINSCIESKLLWFEGICDNVCKNGEDEFIQISSIHKDYLIEIQLMLQTMGINTNVTKNKEIFKLLVSSVDIYKLTDLVFSPHRLEITKREPQRSASQFIKVIVIEDEDRIDDTYCFTESKKNRGIFEGVLLGNCSEIMEYSDSSKYACCVLASIVLPTYVVPNLMTLALSESKKRKTKRKDGTEKHSDTEKHPEKHPDTDNLNGMMFDHNKLAEVVKVITRNLNKLIDINYYPVEETRVSNMSERPIGIGIQGLADVFYKLGLAYDSEEAIKLDREIMETIYFSALSESLELSKKYGPYETFKGSPISEGYFQFDLWKKFPTDKNDVPEIIHSGRYDWDKLRRQIKKHGVRNSLVTALMPTASTSQIMGSASEAFEPITSNCYTRRVKAGEFMVINPYMASDLIKIGMWDENMRNKLLTTRGSIQNIDGIPLHLKNVYKTVWELKQKVLIDHSIARAPYVDQSQSLNLYFADGDPKKITGAQFYAWSKGLKTGSYYIRTKPVINSASFTLTAEEPEHDTEILENSENCDSCGS